MVVHILKDFVVIVVVGGFVNFVEWTYIYYIIVESDLFETPPPQYFPSRKNETIYLRDNKKHLSFYTALLLLLLLLIVVVLQNIGSE